MTFPALMEAEGKLKQRQDSLHKIFTEAGPKLDMDAVKCIEGDSKAKVAKIRELNAEMDDLGKQVDDLKAVQRAADAVRNLPEQSGSGPDADSRREAEAKAMSLGQAFLASAAHKGRTSGNGPEAHLEIELKTLMTTSAGWAPESIRTGKVVDYATRPIQIIDLIPTTETGQAAVTYMEETTLTNNAAEASEGGTYGEAALALTERSSTVRKIAVWLPMTDEQLEDEPRARGYIDNRMPFLVRQRLDSQILVGDGSAPNLRGINNVVGIQTQAKGTDPSPDAIYKAMTLVRVTGRAMPDAVVMHPNDWQDIRLLRTADGIYIWGSPSEMGVPRIWGRPVIESDAQTENTAVVGDFGNFSELAIRRGIDVQVSNSHSTYFVEGKQAIRADMRAALIFYRPAAFATVTGI